MQQKTQGTIPISAGSIWTNILVITIAASVLCGFDGAPHNGRDPRGLPSLKEFSAFTPEYYNSVQTYTNPVLPGDHPDPTLLKVGNDFYHCGSSFHFTPYLPIYHSKDLVHWEVISRVVTPAAAETFVADRPSGGIWQGAITHFYGSYWIYFSANGQWFCKAHSPAGPWSAPVRVNSNPQTGNLGYDNSIFVDDDGKPYMLIKNGQKVNRIQALGPDGQLTDTLIDLDWINAGLQYSWAEGPVMCKRHGYYYYFPAGDVSGGQYVLRTKKLTGDSTYWERLGDFFQPVTDPNEGFRRPNHISAPIELADGTWWTLGQSYEKYPGDDWSGTGRQTSLYPVIWDGDRPWGLAPTTQPIVKPDLSRGSIPWTSAQGDDFNNNTLGLQWHFLNRKAARNYSLTDRKGWLRLIPDSGRTHLVQKETDHYYTALTRVDLRSHDTTAKAGIYLTNGNQHVTARLFVNGRRILFQLDTAARTIPNTAGDIVWLKLQRNGHALTGYYSRDGNHWTSLGAPISAVNLDKTQPGFNSWVGTSLGLFAEGRPADFDFFTCKDAFSPLTAAGYSNYYGVTTLADAGGKIVTNTSANGGWLMIAGVETGNREATAIELTLAAKTAGNLGIWLDDLQHGKLIATVPIQPTGSDSQWKKIAVPIKPFKGHHDVFIEFPAGEQGAIMIRSLRFS
ncbi:MAG TPA: family 43 glycosylhydrolase [Puia sp.]|nr:family 43 glycosylhydrolase [Puia sp.]